MPTKDHEKGVQKSVGNYDTKKDTSEQIPHNNSPDLEIKDAYLIFGQVWGDLVKTFGVSNLRFPREIIWLGGAPGSGKGTNTPYILKTRGITAPPIVISKLLTSPSAKRLKDSGNMVGDRDVISKLFFKLLDDIYEAGVVVDGFPRTKVQVECLKLFYNKLIELRKEFLNTPIGNTFKRPVFHLAVLFVDERISVERQLSRGKEVREHNERVKSSKTGKLLEERATDYSESTARKRYRVFKESTYESLQSLRKIFHYHFVDASGSVSEVQKNISSEFQYQSSLELDHDTFDRIRDIPLASEIILHARQELVERLDNYQKDHPELFRLVISKIENKIVPILKRHAISGSALVNSEDTLFNKPVAIAMLIDILTERGYHVIVDSETIDIPIKFMADDNSIISEKRTIYRIHIRFQGSRIRRGLVTNNSDVSQH